MFRFFFLIAIIAATPSNAASWRVLESNQFQDWEASYNEYTSRNGYFCSAQTFNENSDVFRLNFYRDGAVHFLEVFNEEWNYFEGNATFTLRFDNGYNAVLKGKSWGDSLTHDFIDRKQTMAIFELLSVAKSLEILNSNNGVIGSFSLSGSNEALKRLIECFTGAD